MSIGAIFVVIVVFVGCVVDGSVSGSYDALTVNQAVNRTTTPSFALPLSVPPSAGKCAIVSRMLITLVTVLAGGDPTSPTVVCSRRCFNGGTCLKSTLASESTEMCLCPLGFTGSLCDVCTGRRRCVYRYVYPTLYVQTVIAVGHAQ
jgi:hypothetical protein